MPMIAGAQAQDRIWARRFWILFGLLCAARAGLAAALPLFGDEAFYAWESRHLAWAYSDLPGFTAWLIAAGRGLLDGELGVRLGFLLLGALLPLQLLRIADAAGLAAVRWQVGMLALLLPLLSINGLLALPEPPLLLAAALCLHALLRLQRLGPQAPWALALPCLFELLMGLALGAFSHYRFLAVLGAGGLAVLLVPSARALLRDPRLWLVAGLGLLAWLPLLMFDAGGDHAGWRFQFVERHPWQFQPEALWVPIEQALVATPLAWILMLAAIPAALRARVAAPGPALLAASGGGLLLGLYLIGLFADRERVSFHWPLLGQLALLPLLAARLQAASMRLRRWTWILLATGAAAGWLLCALLAHAPSRAAVSHHLGIDDNFSGAAEVAAAVEARLAALPPGTRLLADNFLLAAQLKHAGLGAGPFGVMDHPLNAKHGRARQLALWRVDERGWIGEDDPVRLLVVEETALGLRARQPWQRHLCARLPGLRAAGELQLHAGAKRYLLLEQRPREASVCEVPALAYLDAPAPGDTVSPRFELRAWAIQDGVGLSRVEVLLDGQTVAQARSDLYMPGVLEQWPHSDDPRHPQVGVQADVVVPPALLGTRVLGLRLHARDGRVRELGLARIHIRE
jgi:4-amino-4-deoxy-L-arabinose transferase-like glycosyltransferase